ncbi:MAG: hypothetical protein WD136_05500, partial [Cyanobium sp.]
LMDRYESHTRHCRACSGALRGIRRWRPLVLVALGLELLLAAWLPGLGARLTLLVLLVLTGLLLRQFNRWERRLLRGDGHPPRNAPDRSEAVAARSSP